MADFDIQGAKKAGYSDAEIADYLGKQSGFDVAGARKAGYSDAEILGHLTAAPPKSVGEKAADVGEGVLDTINKGVNILGTQFTKGITGLAGLPATVEDLGNRGAKYVLGKILGPGQAKEPMPNSLPTAQGMNDYIFGNLGVPEANAADIKALTLHNPFGIGRDVNVGKIIDSGLQAIPGFAFGAGSAATKVVPGFAAGAGSEAAGQATEGTPFEIPARFLGGAAGFKAGSKLVSPLPANLSPEESRLVQIAKDKNIPMTVGQETGRGRAIESAVSRFPTSQGRMADFADTQKQAINRDALAQAGATGDRVDPTSMNRVIGQAAADFEAAKNASGPVTLRPDFYNKAGKAVGDYQSVTAPSDIVPMVAKKLDDFFSTKLMKGGNYPQLSGEEYQAFRKGLNDTMQSLKPGSGEFRALKGIREALDDAMEASLPADQAEAWRTVRKNWSNLKTITKAAAGGSIDSRNTGNLSPSALSTALRSRQGVDKFATTTGGLNDTARVASYLADTIPNSGTPQTLLMQGATTGGPIAAGYAAGGTPGAIAAAAGMAAPNLIARAMTGTGGGGVLRRYLANQAMPNARPELYRGLLRSSPYTLAPGAVVSAPRLEDRRR